MRVLGVVPARGGSKGIPRKNLAALRGRPLLAWTAEAALSARRLSRVVLSTDDEEIATVGREWGLEVPFLRPPELAADDSPTLAVLQHALRRLEEAGDRFDAVMTLQPTTPLRRARDIDGAIGLLESSGADSVVSLVDAGWAHPFKMRALTECGGVVDPPYAPGFAHTPRQRLPRLFLLEGSIYLSRRDLIVEGGMILGPDTRPWIVPRERAVNIDEAFDLWLAERLLERPEAGEGAEG